MYVFQAPMLLWVSNILGEATADRVTASSLAVELGSWTASSARDRMRDLDVDLEAELEIEGAWDSREWPRQSHVDRRRGAAAAMDLIGVGDMFISIEIESTDQSIQDGI